MGLLSYCLLALVLALESLVDNPGRAETPEIEVIIVASNEAPSGIGEPGVPPVAAAVANAVFAATGVRVRELPFAGKALKRP